MSSYALSTIKNLPDISFIEWDTLEDVKNRMIKNVEKAYEQEMGQKITLSPSDPLRLTTYAYALQAYQEEQYIDRAGKQDLIKYSYGDYLENLGASRGVTRNQAAPSQCILQFHISTILSNAVSIPKGTRVTNGKNYFKTMEYVEVPIGSQTVDVMAVCTEDGQHTNNIPPGRINRMVDLIPYVDKVENVTPTVGGADKESDENLAERIYYVPGSYSVAGPDDGYRFWTKTYNQNIGDVKVVSPRPVEVEIYFLLQNGDLPDRTIIEGLEAFLQSENIRPLTDKVSVKAPTVVQFDLDLVYYINYSDQNKAVMIQNRVQQAISDYLVWQTHYIGRDINPSELTKRIVEAGAKRVVINSPTFTIIPNITVARVARHTVSYGGVEID